MRASSNTAILLWIAAAGCYAAGPPEPDRTMTQPTVDLQTLAEQSGFRQTGRYAEVERLCQAYAQAWPNSVRCFEFGRTPEGRPMLALIASRVGTLAADELRARKVPVLMLQGGIHPGESDGKDAGFMVLREWLQSPAETPLSRIAVLFVPVFNVDGHERFGPWNRANQAGPEEMGWLTTAQNLNLNRDYAKADSPEMQHMLRLLGEWDPIVYADLHVTDGADFEHDISITATPIFEGEPELQDAGRKIRDQVIARLAAHGSLPLDFYPNLLRTDDPASGFEVGAHPARYSTGYWALHNRFAVLVETHSWKDYATRVRITRHTIVALAELAATQGADWLEQARKADAAASGLGGTPVALDYEAGEHVSTIAFRGYAYTREPSPISGGLATRYDPATPKVWNVPLKDTVRATVTVTAPRGGYVVPAAYAELLGPRLALHGVEFRRLDTGRSAAVEAFRASSTRFEGKPFEGRTQVKLGGEWKSETREIPAGSLFVPIAQARARLAMALLEPRAPDSFAAWGFFNAVLEQKEYIEPYVAELFAREMLARDPALVAQFADKLDQDPAFARDPAARLDFFYRRHPSWDDRYNLYPVYRVDSERVLQP
ncbi:MAG TPA: M14 family zinc carboxypeptidase [Solimonas sp.]|nr:M14 family zinc carboxypeptidase [Solimonas sp.]